MSNTLKPPQVSIRINRSGQQHGSRVVLQYMDISTDK